MKLMHVGDTIIMLPAAAVITAWLLASRAWRLAFSWSALFVLGAGLVAASKIAFIGWETEIRALDFKALSGHAMLTTAVAPVLFYLVLQRASRLLQAIGILIGMLLGIMVSVLLVVFNEHSVSEVIAGGLVGSCVSLCFIRIAHGTPIYAGMKVIVLSLLVFLAVRYLHPASIDYWMMRAALLLSGHARPHDWDAG